MNNTPIELVLWLILLCGAAGFVFGFILARPVTSQAKQDAAGVVIPPVLDTPLLDVRTLFHYYDFRIHLKNGLILSPRVLKPLESEKCYFNQPADGTGAFTLRHDKAEGALIRTLNAIEIDRIEIRSHN